MKSKPHTKRKQKERSLWQTVSVGLGGGVVMAFALLLLFAKIAFESKDPSGLLMPLGILCGVLSALFAGALTVRYDGRGNVVPAFLVGVGFALILAVLSFVFPAQGQNLWRWLFYAALVLCCFLGGFLALKRPKKRRHRG